MKGPLGASKARNARPDSSAPTSAMPTERRATASRGIPDNCGWRRATNRNAVSAANRTPSQAPCSRRCSASSWRTRTTLAFTSSRGKATAPCRQIGTSSMAPSSALIRSRRSAIVARTASMRVCSATPWPNATSSWSRRARNRSRVAAISGWTASARRKISAGASRSRASFARSGQRAASRSRIARSSSTLRVKRPSSSVASFTARTRSRIRVSASISSMYRARERVSRPSSSARRKEFTAGSSRWLASTFQSAVSRSVVANWRSIALVRPRSATMSCNVELLMHPHGPQKSASTARCPALALLPAADAAHRRAPAPAARRGTRVPSEAGMVKGGLRHPGARQQTGPPDAKGVQALRRHRECRSGHLGDSATAGTRRSELPVVVPGEENRTGAVVRADEVAAPAERDRLP